MCASSRLTITVCNAGADGCADCNPSGSSTDAHVHDEPHVHPPADFIAYPNADGNNLTYVNGYAPAEPAAIDWE